DRDDTDPAGPWNVPADAYNLAESRFRQLHGPIFAEYDRRVIGEIDDFATIQACNVRAGDLIRPHSSSESEFYFEVQRVRLTSDSTLEIQRNHVAGNTDAIHCELDTEIELSRD